ncbi:MAG TPA: chaperone modulator CbpM [Casimicrobiaceae bacterium]|nr:chaperone modulator CbpM [Casimicrobiaceae bacterium]
MMKVMTGVVLEEVSLTIDELAWACACERRWVVEHVESGALTSVSISSGERVFASAELARARRLLALEREFDADPELAALTVDLIEEVGRLRRRLRD